MTKSIYSYQNFTILFGVIAPEIWIFTVFAILAVHLQTIHVGARLNM